MRDEPLEHLHHHDPVPRDPVRRAGGVVEHQHRRHGADVLEHPEQPHGARTPRSPRATPPRTACSNTETTPPGSARPSGSPPPRPAPNRNPPASRPATTPTPGYPSPGSRCSCLQRFTYRCTIWYEPSNPCSSTSLSYTRLAVCRRYARHEPVRLQPLADQRLVRVELRDRRRTGRGLRRAVLQLRVCVCSMELWPVEHRVSVQLSGGF